MPRGSTTAPSLTGVCMCMHMHRCTEEEDAEGVDYSTKPESGFLFLPAQASGDEATRLTPAEVASCPWR